MFKKLHGKLEAANFKSAVAKGTLACPSCGAKPSGTPANVSGILTCSACGTRASANEWAAAGRPGELVGNPDSPPVGTKITRGNDASGASVWNIPASGKSGGLLFFAVFWCAITALVSGGFLFAFLSGEAITNKGPGKAPDWVLIPFFSLFWAVGLGMFYAGFRNKFAKHRLTVDAGSVTLRRELFGKARDRSLPAAAIKQVSQVEFYQKNYQPVHGIEIRGDAGKLRFGSILTAEEKAWLVADIRRAIFGNPVPVAIPPASVVAAQAVFSVVLPNSRKQVWPLAVMLVAMGIAFIFIGIRFIDPHFMARSADAPVAVDLFDKVFGFLTHGFRSIWIIMSGAMAVAGVTLIAWLIKTGGQETRIEGSDSEIALRTYKHDRILKDRSFSRTFVTDIRASVSGSSNNRVMKRLELIVGDRAEKLASWIDGVRADEIVGEVRRALGQS
jgi:hypothetical protein